MASSAEDTSWQISSNISSFLQMGKLLTVGSPAVSAERWEQVEQIEIR